MPEPFLSTLAVLVMLAVAASPAIIFVAWYRRVGHPWDLFLFYVLDMLYTRLLWRTRIVGGPFPVPDDGGAVVVSNHRGPIDPAFVNLASRPWVHWMVAKEYFAWPLVGGVLRGLRCIPVGRTGVDTAATKQAIRLVKEGGFLGMFPEGQLNATDDLLLPGRPGAALIALKGEVPVIPCYLEDTPNDGTTLGFLWPPARAVVHIGPTIDTTPYLRRLEQGDEIKEVQVDLTRHLLCEIAALAGVDDYQPQIAGRRWLVQQQTSADGAA